MSDRGVEPNRRGVGRQRVLKKGLILFNDGRSSIGCHIVDISDTGAKLAPVDVFSCPGEFLLKLPLGEPRECEVMWRRGDRVGVRFLGAHHKTASDDPPAQLPTAAVAAGVDRVQQWSLHDAVPNC